MSRHGENIWKRKDGRWEARYVKGRDSRGKALYASVYAKTYAEVKKKREAVLQELKSHPSSSLPAKSLGMIIQEYLEDHKFEIKFSTYARYVEISEKHLIPDLGLMPVSEFTRDDGNSYVKKLLSNGKAQGKGLADKTVKDIASVLKLVLKYAEEKHYILNAPIDFFVPKQGHPTIQILAPSQRERLETFVCTTTDSYKFGVYLCLYTGLRIGEICALQWKDIDCVNSTISVNKTILRVKNVGGSTAKTKILINTPKTPSSKRLIPLPKELSEKLRQLKLELSPSDNYYVLTGTGKFIEPRNYYERYKRYLRLCELGDFNFHALRHTFATRCIEAGVDPKVLSEILGHASVQITLDRYVHPSLEIKRTSLGRLFSA